MRAKPKNHARNLERLRELSQSIHASMEDGSFYTLSYFERYRKVREIKKLYNRLIGSLSETALRNAVSFAAVMMMLSGAGTGCDDDQNMASVEIDLGMDRQESLTPGLNLAMAPSDVIKITLSVNGPGIKPRSIDLALDQDKVFFTVPAGHDRVFSVRAETLQSTPTSDFYSGSATIDLKRGELKQVPITMEFIEGDDVPPVPGNSGIITTSAITFNSVHLTWTAATDNLTPQADLEYAVYRSENDDINTADECEANGTLVQDYTADLSYVTATGLASDTTYYFNVVVRDAAQNTAAYDRQSQTTAAADPVFSTTASTVSLTGLSTTDTLYPSLGDIDGDGDMDLMISELPGQYFLHLYQNNSGSFTSITVPNDLIYPIPPNGYYGLRVLVDIDGDADIDVSGISAYTQHLYTFINTGTASTFATFNDPSALISGIVADNRGTASYGDIDNDGDLDVVTGSTGSINDTHVLRLYENTGSATSPVFGTSASIGSAITFTNAIAPVFVDIDNDGDLDIIAGLGNYSAAAGFFGSTILIENTGTESSPVFADPASNPFGIDDDFALWARVFPAFTDFDNDGDQDLFIGGRSNSSLFYYENTLIP